MRRPVIKVCTAWALSAGAAALLALALLLWLQAGDAAEHEAVRFGKAVLTIETAKGIHTFRVEVARTPEQWARGLMHRTTLAPDAGMLFLFPKARRVSMWMRDTLIPLDMVFITRSGRVAEVIADTQPLSLHRIAPRTPVPSVLEVRAGTAERLGIRPGDRVRWHTDLQS